MNALRYLGMVLLLFMFVGSGVSKIIKLGDTQTKQFTTVYKLPYSIARALVFSAGLVEVVAVLMIIYGQLKKNKKIQRQGTLGLILFSVAATLLFKIYPKFKKIQFFANLSVIGGLILFYDCLK